MINVVHFVWFAVAIKSDPSGPQPVACTSSSLTPEPEAKSGRRSARAAKSGKVKVEPEEEEEEEEVVVKPAKSGGKGKSGAKERPAGKYCPQFKISHHLCISLISYDYAV